MNKEVRERPRYTVQPNRYHPGEWCVLYNDGRETNVLIIFRGPDAEARARAYAAANQDGPAAPGNQHLGADSDPR